MIFWQIILVLSLITCCTSRPQILHSFYNFGGCQSYSVINFNREMKYICKSFSEKIGSCPTNTSQINACNFEELLCLGDWHCPPGFKCCKDDNVSNFNICKEAVFAIDDINLKKTNDSTNNTNGNGKGNENTNSNGNSNPKPEKGKLNGNNKPNTNGKPNGNGNGNGNGKPNGKGKPNGNDNTKDPGKPPIGNDNKKDPENSNGDDNKQKLPPTA